jgi:hypothetical protein
MTNTSELWVQMGNVSSVKDGRMFLPIHELCSSLSDITCRVLPGAHALSVCNTTSTFFGNGKKLVYKILKDAASDIHDLDNLGDPEDRGGFARQEVCQTLVWNEARRIC